MLAQNLRLGLSILALAAFPSATTVACTFPTVDYNDSTPDSGPPCSATGHCITDAKKCNDAARSRHSDCVDRCSEKPGEMCVSDCEAQLSFALATCNTNCQSCGQQQQQG